MMIDYCDFNPRNLPNERHGMCQNPEHSDWADGIPKRGHNLNLVMYYSDIYQEKWCDCDKKSELSDDEFDKLYDEMEKKKWKPNSEAYYCETCVEVLNESSC